MATRLSRDAQRIQTHERLLAAAARQFALHGYDGVSVDAIAADAGFTKGAFYAHFESKEMVFLALLDRHMQREAAELDQVLEETRRRGGGLHAIERWLDTLNADADWALLSAELQRHARRSPAFAERYAGLLATHRDRLGELLAALFAISGKRPPMRTADLADAFMALSHGLAAQRALPLAGNDPSGAIIRQLLAALLASAPARPATGK